MSWRYSNSEFLNYAVGILTIADGLLATVLFVNHAWQAWIFLAVTLAGIVWLVVPIDPRGTGPK